MKTFYFIFIISLISFASCSKDAGIEPSPFRADTMNTDVSVKNGMLVIKDKETLNKLILNHLNKSPEELKNWQDSIGFKSYQLFYDDIFAEYESVVENAIQEQSENSILEFMEANKDNATFPGGNIDGVPNFSIEPKVSASYTSVANMNGKFILGSEIIDATKIGGTLLKSVDSFTCDKKHDKRKMHIRLTVDDPNFSYNVAEVTHRKKILFGWVSYSTRYYWRHYANDPNYYYTSGDVGSPYRIVLQRYSKYLEMWNRGVGEGQKCVFSW